MKISLIITTYNWPEALKAVLNSVLQQTRMPDEVIIADDGSTAATEQLVTHYQSLFPVPLLHSWQQDKGFRLARSRNKAIDMASNDYIVMIDGDIILNRDFIADHQLVAEPGYFVTGKRVKMSPKLSQRALQQQTRLNCCSQGISRGREQAIRLPLISRMLSKKVLRSIEGIHGCNLAFWRQDVLDINGFNQEFEGWGPEDREFAQRMINANVLRKQLKFSAVGFHIDHNESCREMLPKNDDIFQRSIRQKATWCRVGINEF
ncbi:glycosyltransferase [Shewanella sp. Scap07]|uniref:glycosyltransferase family 2 protein n=1 Tax=Shewanella sp. Scap07 TaxID=2589987 RepID=UPI0015C00313|nr:glycosyltransferase family 2 protein [Shewanella sp. Scap07]QLE87520.1 glycosyltransferase [Shewanella sp. Scap07]